VKRSSVAHLNCSIAQSLDIVGEWWTPLVLRNILMGQRRFEAIQADLGIARNILSDRLTTLVHGGVLDRVKYQDSPERYEYRLTEMGLELFDVLMTLMAWGDKWLSPDGPPVVLVHQECGHETRPVLACEHCAGTLTAHTVKLRRGPGSPRPESLPAGAIH
jgi:DNA-binding HxlR family transcriptional regulator